MMYVNGDCKYVVCKYYYNVGEWSGYYTIGMADKYNMYYLNAPFFKEMDKAQIYLDKLAKKHNWEVVSNGKSSSSGL